MLLAHCLACGFEASGDDFCEAASDWHHNLESWLIPRLVVDRTEWPVPGKFGEIHLTLDGDEALIKIRVPACADPGVTRAIIRGAFRDAGAEPDAAIAEQRSAIEKRLHEVEDDPFGFIIRGAVQKFGIAATMGVDVLGPVSTPREGVWGAIPTEYGRDLFRSRTEARRAVFLATLGVEYRYELEGFDLGGPRYLPDFYLPGLRCWLEIKPFAPLDDEREKARRLAEHTAKDVYLLWGNFSVPSSEGADEPLVMKWSPTGFSGEGYFWAQCVICERIGPAISAEHPLAGCWCDSPTTDRATPRLVAAYTGARQEHFGT